MFERCGGISCGKDAVRHKLFINLGTGGGLLLYVRAVL